MYSTSLPVVLLCATLMQLTDGVAISKFSSYLDANGSQSCAADKPSEELTISSKINCGLKCVSRVSCLFFTFQKTTKKCRLYDFQPKLFDKVEGCLSFISKTLATSPPSVVVLKVGNSGRLNCRRSTQHVRWNLTEFESKTPVVIVEDCRVLDEFNGSYDVDSSDFGCNLIIPNPSLNHAGRYTCEDVLSDANPATSEVTVLEFTQECVDNNFGLPIYFGQEVTFQCAVTYKGYTMPSIEWTDSNGTTVLDARTLRLESSVDSYLMIKGFSPNVGPFKCTVTVTVASTTDYSAPVRTCTCSSTQIPVIVLEPVCYDNSSAGEIVVQEYLNLTCTLTYISGSWMPSLQWYDSNENPVTNATIQTTGDQVSTYILIPAYYPTIKTFTFVTFASDAESYKSSWTSKEIAVLECPQGFLYISTVGSCYKAVFSCLTWDEASQKCSQLYRGSYLSMINNATEQSAIATFLDSQFNLTTGVVRSCSTIPGTGNLVWISGRTLKPGSCDPFAWQPVAEAVVPISYTNWSKGGPKCTPSNHQNCISLSPSQNYSWIDIPCNYSFFALCEYGPW